MTGHRVANSPTPTAALRQAWQRLLGRPRDDPQGAHQDRGKPDLLFSRGRRLVASAPGLLPHPEHQSRGRAGLRPGNGMTLPSAPERMSRSCWFSRVSWFTTRTRAGTSARSWASSLFLRGDRLLELGDGGAEARLVAVVGAAFLDALVELVLQVGVPLGERVAGDICLDGERDDGQRAVGPLGSAGQDAVHRGADPGRARRVRGSCGSPGGGDPGAVVLVGLLAEPGGTGAQPVSDGLGDVSSLAFQGELPGRGAGRPAGRCGRCCRSRERTGPGWACP